MAASRRGTKSRHDRIVAGLTAAEAAGIIRTGWYAAGGGRAGGTRWLVTPTGHGERSFSTAQVEDFLLGIAAAAAAEHDRQTLPRPNGAPS